MPKFRELLQLWGLHYGRSQAVTGLLGCRPQWDMISSSGGKSAASNLPYEIDTSLQLIDATIPRLPPTDKSLIILRYKYGYSYARIAKRLKVCERTATAQVELAEKTLALFIYNSLQFKACEKSVEGVLSIA